MASKLDDQTLVFGTQVEDLTEDEKARSVLVSKIPKSITENRLTQGLFKRHFEWVRNGGGKIDRIHFPDDETAIITYKESEGLWLKILIINRNIRDINDVKWISS